MAQGDVGNLALKFTADIADIQVKVDAMKKQLGGFASDSQKSFDGVTGALNRLVASVPGGDIFTRLFEAATNPAALLVESVVAVSTALVAMSVSAARATTELENNAKQAGVSAEQFLALRTVAEEAGSNADVLTMAMSRLNEDVIKAQDPTNVLAFAFKQLGVNADASVSPMDMMKSVLTQINSIQNEQQKMAAAADFFGLRQARQILPLLPDIVKNLQAATDAEKALGAAPSARLAADTQEWNKATSKIELAWAGIKNAIAEGVLPTLTKIVETTADWIAKLRTFQPPAWIEKISNLILSTPLWKAVLGPQGVNVPPDTYGGPDNASNSALSANANGSLTSTYAKTAAQLKAEADAAQAELAAYNAELNKLRDELTKINGEQVTAEQLTAEWVAKQVAAKHVVTQEQIAQLTAANQLVIDARTTVQLEQQRAQYMKDLADEASKELDERTKIEQKTDDFLGKLKEESDAQQFQLSLIGKMPDEIARATAEYQKQQEIQTEIDRLVDQYNIAIEQGNIPKAEALRVAMQQVSDAEDSAVKGAGNLAVALQQANVQAGQQRAMWDQIAGMTEQFFSNIVSNGKNAFQQLGDALKQYFIKLLAQMVEQQWIVPIMASFAPGVAQAGASSLATGTGPLGQVQQLFGAGGSNILDAGASLFGAGGMFGPAADMVGGFTDAGVALDAATTGFGATLTTLSTALAPIVTALPYVGIALMAAQAFGLFNKDPSQVKGQFAFGGPFEDNVSVQSKYFGSMGFGDAGTQYFSGAAAKVFDQMVADSLDAVGARMTDAQRAKTKTDLQSLNLPGQEGTFTTEDFLQKYGGQVLQQVLGVAVGNLDAKLGALVTGFNGSAQEVENFTNSLLAFYDASGTLPDAVKQNLENAIGETQASVDEITKIAQSAAVVFTAQSANAMDDAQKLIAQSGSAYNAFMAQGDALSTLIGKTDESAAAAQALAKATGDYYTAEVKLLAQIQQTKGAIDKMFSGTKESILTSTMNDQQKYNYYQQQAGELEKQLANTTDPQKISDLTSRINDLIGKAWNLLSPDQQKQLQQQFIASIDKLDATAQKQLEQASSDVQKSAQQHLDDAATKMTDVAQKLSDAADVQKTAADTQLQAAQTPKQVDVTVNVAGGSGGTEVGYFGSQQ